MQTTWVSYQVELFDVLSPISLRGTAARSAQPGALWKPRRAHKIILTQMQCPLDPWGADNINKELHCSTMPVSTLDCLKLMRDIGIHFTNTANMVIYVIEYWVDSNNRQNNEDPYQSL